jgi:gliding motility-associated-like protein
MKKLFTILFALLITFSLKSQSNVNFNINNPLSIKRFVENKGQFDNRLGGNKEQVLFAVDHGSTQIFFTKKGVIYRIDDKQKNFYRKKGDKNSPRLFMETVVVNIEFDGANPNLNVVGKDKSEDYHTYSKLNSDKSTTEFNQLSGFKKIVYQNIYPNIDLEYTFHPEEGLKYAFVMKAGANPENIKMKYDKDKKISINQKGDIIIKTLLGDFKDHAPFTYYENSKKKTINSKFKLENNVVSFELENYDKNKEVIIDPWTVTPGLGNSNRIWNIGTDINQNVYIYGGDTPIRVIKYNSTGTLQWSYNTTWDSASYWIGTMLVDSVGNSYITTGTSGRVRKLNTAGVMQWENIGGSALGVELEYWKLALNCDETQLFCGGMRSPSGINVNAYRGAVLDLNLANGAILGFKEVGFQSPGILGMPNIKEVRDICSAPNNNFYYLTLDSVGAISPSLNVIYQKENDYNFSYGVPSYGVTNQGINAMVADKDFLYTHNGATLHKRNLYTGDIILTASVPAGITQFEPVLNNNNIGNGGIALDSCGNVYVGSGNGIYKFDNNLSLLTSANTPAAVHDLAVNGNGEIVACGNGFVTSVNLSSCGKPKVICVDCLTIDPVPSTCVTDAPFNLTANLAGGTWSGSGITNANTGTFSPSVAGIGSHVIHYTLPNPAVCGIDSITIVVGSCAPLQVCIEANGDLKVYSGTGFYTWEEQTTTLDCSTCFPAVPPFVQPCSTPPGCAVSVLTWVAFATGTTIPSPSNFPIRVTDNSGSTLLINSLAALQPCSAIVCPTITMAITNQSNESCGGANDGSATVSASGGNGNYTYSWSPGSFIGATRNNMAAGVYTVTATDIDGCDTSITVTILGQPPLNLSISATPTSCTENTGAATTTISGGTGNYTYSWSNGATTASLTNLPVGTYTLEVTDSDNCQISETVNITSLNGPTLSINSSTPATCFGLANGTANVSATGGTGTLTYSWTPSGATTSNPTNLAGGIEHTVTVTDQSGCSVVGVVNINQPTQVTNQATIAGADCGSSNGNIILTTSGGQSPYTYLWSNAETTSSINNLIPGLYTVTITDASNCTSIDTVVVPQIGNLDVIANPNLVNLEPGEQANLNVSGGVTYTWTPSVGLSCVNCQNPIASPSVTTTYFVTGTDNFGCTGVDTVLIVVESVCGEVFIPTIFSPNKDGQNDFQCVFGNCIAQLSFGIYNRWGEKLFESNQQTECWDGKHKDEYVSTGVYFYKLTVITTDGEEKVSSGNFNLVR